MRRAYAAFALTAAEAPDVMFPAPPIVATFTGPGSVGIGTPTPYDNLHVAGTYVSEQTRRGASRTRTPRSSPAPALLMRD